MVHEQKAGFSDSDSESDSSGRRSDSAMLSAAIADRSLGYVAVVTPESDALSTESPVDRSCQTSIAFGKQSAIPQIDSDVCASENEMSEARLDTPQSMIADNSFPWKEDSYFLIFKNTRGLGQETLFEILHGYDGVLHVDLKFYGSQVSPSDRFPVIFSSMDGVYRVLKDENELKATYGLICLNSHAYDPGRNSQASDEIAGEAESHHDDNMNAADNVHYHESTELKKDATAANLVAVKSRECIVNPRRIEHECKKATQAQKEASSLVTETSTSESATPAKLCQVEMADDIKTESQPRPVSSYEAGILRVLQHRIDSLERAQDMLENQLRDVRQIVQNAPSGDATNRAKSKAGLFDTWVSIRSNDSVMEILFEVLTGVLMTFVISLVATYVAKKACYTEFEQSMNKRSPSCVTAPSHLGREMESAKAELGKMMLILRDFFFGF